MFGQTHFEPWQGDQYGKSSPRLLVIGESRFDEEYTDKTIIQDLMNGYQHRTFTNFVQAATGTRCSERDYDASRFWKSVVFYNYNTTFFPGDARLPLPWSERNREENARLLREVLLKWTPSHAIVWGMSNWCSLRVEGAEWIDKKAISGMADPHRCVTLKSVPTLFARTSHPSWPGFSYDRWAPMLKAFLAM